MEVQHTHKPAGEAFQKGISILVYYGLRLLARAIMKLFFDLEYDGRHYINTCEGPVILAGNHTGWLDTLAIVTASNRRVRFLVHENVLKWPVIGKIIHTVGGIKVGSRNGVYAIEEALRCLAESESICIFPEGKLSVDSSIAKFKNGVAKLHRESGCPMIPFAIYGGYEAWPYNRKLPRLHKMAIHFGVPLLHAELDNYAVTRELEEIVGYMKTSLERRLTSDAEYAQSVLSLMQAKSDVFSARPAVCMKAGDRWYEISYAELSRQSINLSSYLMDIGINKGDRIAILSESRPEFAVCFFGAIRVGATVVPLDAKLTNRELRELINDCTPKVLFVSEHLLPHYEEIKTDLRSVAHCFVIDRVNGTTSGRTAGGMPALTGSARSSYAGKTAALPGSVSALPEYPHIQDLMPSAKLPSRERTLDEVALIIYTSGTTGSPKGVMTSFENLVFQAKQFEEIVSPKEGDRFLSILPLNHLLELTHGFLGVLHAGGTIYYSPSIHPRDIIALMKEKRISGMIAVPLFYKTLRNGIEREIKKGGLKQLWWQIATVLATVGAWQCHACRRFRRILFAPLLKNLGGKLKLLVSGGAPLDIETARFFDLLGIDILEGYGLTETSPVISCNTPWANRLGSVGRPIPGVEVKIDSAETGCGEGEVLTRGPHIMQGYFKQDDLTAEAIDKDGWFHTGDIGKIDKDGFLYITGRIKNLIVLGGGKKVHPEEVEAILSACPHVKEMCVLGVASKGGSKEGTEEVCAVVVPTDAAIHLNPNKKELGKLLTGELQNLCSQLASYKRPTRFVFMDSDLPKTTTRKVRRKELLSIISSNVP